MPYPDSLLLRTSRIKALPVALLLPAFLFLAAAPAIASLGGTGETDARFPGIVLPLAIPTLLLGYAEYVAIRRVIVPDTLLLTRQGWSLSRTGKRQSHLWADYKQARRQYVSSGKSGSLHIALDPVAGGKPVLIPGEVYDHPFDAVLAAVQGAQDGRIVDLGPVKPPLASTLGAVPTAAAAFTLTIGFVLLCAWGLWHP